MTSLADIDLDFRPESYPTPNDSSDDDHRLPGEVIAWVHYPSNIHQETTHVLARPSRGGWAYRVADDHDHDWDINPGWSQSPLTLRVLISLIDSADAAYPVPGIVEHWDFLHEDCATKPAALLGYVVVGSQSYHQLGAWYEARFEKWYAAVTGAPRV